MFLTALELFACDSVAFAALTVNDIFRRGGDRCWSTLRWPGPPRDHQVSHLGHCFLAQNPSHSFPEAHVSSQYALVHTDGTYMYVPTIYAVPQLRLHISMLVQAAPTLSSYRAAASLVAWLEREHLSVPLAYMYTNFQHVV